MPKPNSGFVLNPSTNRYIAIDSKVYNRMVKAGVIQPVAPQIVTPPQPCNDVKESIKANVENVPLITNAVEEAPIKKLLAHELTNIVAEHRAKFEKELTQKQSDKLLKQLLYEKLCVTKKSKKSTAPAKPTKLVKKKKTKFVVAQPSSSDSDSDTQSDSSSD